MHFIRKHLIFCLIVLLSGIVSYGQTRNELEQRKRNARSEIEKTNRIIKEISKSKSLSLNRIKLLNKQVINRKELIENLEKGLEEHSLRIHDNELVVNSMEEDIEKIKLEYGRLLQSVYNRRPPYFELIYLFSSKNLNQVYKRTLYLRQYSQYRKKQVHLIVQMQRLLNLKSSELIKQKEEKEIILVELEAENKNLDRDIGKQKAYYSRLKRRERDLRREIRKSEEIARKLDVEIARIMEEETRKAKSIYILTPEEKLISEEFVKNKGKLPWPTRTGIVTGKFGIHAHPVMKNVKIDNGGIDIATISGSKVRNVFKGEVMKIIAIPGANQTVIIRHGGFLTVYRNLVDISIKVGDNIETLEEIGTVYTDHSQGDNTTLHFRIYNEKQNQNPELWLSR